MLDLKNILNDLETVKQKLASRGFDISSLDSIEKLGKDRSSLMTELQKLEAERNNISKQIGMLKSKGEPVDNVLKKVSEIKDKIENIKNDETEVNNKINEVLLLIPNLPTNKTPVGENEDENIEISRQDKIGRGEIKGVKPHYEIAKDLDIVDFERAVKISGTRFWAYKGLGARLVRALESFMLDMHTENGYTEIVPPVLVSTKTMQGTGQLPKFADDLFKIENEDKWLIPTAEVPLTNFYANEIVDLTKPIKLTAYTPCFRAESGSGGRDTRGLIRAHQFNKVELVKIVKQEDIIQEFANTVQDAKNVLEALKLPYKELQLCTGDIGFSSEETIDLEVWLPSEEKYREISSISRFGDFQGRRASIRYKNANGKNQYAFTINGSGLAIDRTIAAILENYQNKDGTIDVPEVLISYMGTKVIK